MNFSKKKNETYANINLAPDIVVEVVETHQGKNLKGVAKSNLATYREHHPR